MDQLTSQQISEWEAVDVLDPIGKWRDDYMMAYLISTISNIAISALAKKGTALTTINDFLPKWGEEPEEPQKQSVDQMKQVLLAIAKQAGIRTTPKQKPTGKGKNPSKK